MAIGAVGGAAAAFTNPFSRQASGGTGQLTPEQQQTVQRLKAIDQKVRQHEAAHQAAGAGLTGGANYQYTRGPDGKQYAVAGDVKIDVSPAQTPKQTIEKARRIEAAAQPSPQDQAVAAQAAQMALQAQAELSAMKNAARNGGQTNSAIAAYTNQAPAPQPTISLFA